LHAKFSTYLHTRISFDVSRRHSRGCSRKMSLDIHKASPKPQKDALSMDLQGYKHLSIQHSLFVFAIARKHTNMKASLSNRWNNLWISIEVEKCDKHTATKATRNFSDSTNYRSIQLFRKIRIFWISISPTQFIVN
jgi:hypothetical protein